MAEAVLGFIFVRVMQWTGTNMEELREFNNKYRSDTYMSTFNSQELNGGNVGSYIVWTAPSKCFVMSEHDYRLWNHAQA